MKKKKGYFLSYKFGDGFGRCYTSYKIKSFDDIERIEKAIKEANPQIKGGISVDYYSTKPIWV